MCYIMRPFVPLLLLFPDLCDCEAIASREHCENEGVAKTRSIQLVKKQFKSRCLYLRNSNTRGDVTTGPDFIFLTLNIPSLLKRCKNNYSNIFRINFSTFFHFYSPMFFVCNGISVVCHQISLKKFGIELIFLILKKYR